MKNSLLIQCIQSIKEYNKKPEYVEESSNTFSIEPIQFLIENTDMVISLPCSSLPWHSAAWKMKSKIPSWTFQNLTNLFFYLYLSPPSTYQTLPSHNEVYISKTLPFPPPFWNTFLLVSLTRLWPFFRAQFKYYLFFWGLPEAESTVLFLRFPNFLFMFFE